MSVSKEENRRKYPLVSAFIDEIAALGLIKFGKKGGAGGKLIHMKENGNEWGAPGQKGVQPVIPPKTTEKGKRKP